MSRPSAFLKTAVVTGCFFTHYPRNRPVFSGIVLLYAGDEAGRLLEEYESALPTSRFSSANDSALNIFRDSQSAGKYGLYRY